MSKQSNAEDNARFVGTLILGAIVAVVWGVLALVDGGSSENPDDYSTCADLATYPGTDWATAECVDDDGDVVKYKDTEIGRRIGEIAGQ